MQISEKPWCSYCESDIDVSLGQHYFLWQQYKDSQQNLPLASGKCAWCGNDAKVESILCEECLLRTDIKNAIQHNFPKFVDNRILPIPEPVEEPSPPYNWVSWTFYNTSGKYICEICGADNRIQPPIQQQTIKCQVCAYVNIEGTQNCIQCQAFLGQVPKAPIPPPSTLQANNQSLQQWTCSNWGTAQETDLPACYLWNMPRSQQPVQASVVYQERPIVNWTCSKCGYNQNTALSTCLKCGQEGRVQAPANPLAADPNLRPNFNT